MSNTSIPTQSLDPNAKIGGNWLIIAPSLKPTEIQTLNYELNPIYPNLVSFSFSSPSFV